MFKKFFIFIVLLSTFMAIEGPASADKTTPTYKSSKQSKKSAKPQCVSQGTSCTPSQTSNECCWPWNCIIGTSNTWVCG